MSAPFRLLPLDVFLLRCWPLWLAALTFVLDANIRCALSAPLPPPSAAQAVTATTGLVTIESDLQKADNATGIVTAVGNVRIVYPDQRVVATARQAQYYSREGRVVLSGDVEVTQADGHSIRAEQLIYLVERERIVAAPAQGQQVMTRYRLNAEQRPGLEP